MARKDKLGKRREIDESTEALKFTRVSSEHLKVVGENNHLLKELLVEQKLTNKYLSLLTEVEFEGINIEE